MSFIAIIISGIIATTVMSGIQYFYTSATGNAQYIPRLLGAKLMLMSKNTTFPRNARLNISIGTIVHYGLGIFFVFAYYTLWSFDIGRPDVIYGLAFGFAHGIIGILLWKVLFSLPPKSSTVNQNNFFIGLLLAHICFSLVAIVSYNFVNQLLRIGEIQP